MSLVRGAVAALAAMAATGGCFDFDGAFSAGGAGGQSGVGGLGGASATSTAVSSTSIGSSTTTNVGSTVATSSDAATTAVVASSSTGITCPTAITTEERFPGSSEGTNTGNKGWTNTQNILGKDGADASVTLIGTQTSELLIGHAFNFSDIPANATIQNVHLNIYRCRTQTGTVDVKDTVIQLIVGGVASGPSQSGATWGADCTAPAQYDFTSAAFALAPNQLLGDFGAELRIHNNAVGTAVGDVDTMTLSVTYLPACP